MTSPNAVADRIHRGQGEGAFVRETPSKLTAQLLLRSADDLEFWRTLRAGPASAGIGRISYASPDDPDVALSDEELDTLAPTVDDETIIRLQVTKAPQDHWIGFYTLSGLIDSLDEDADARVLNSALCIRLAGLAAPIDTLLFPILPWTTPAALAVPTSPRRAHTRPGNARKLIRTNMTRRVPPLIGAWLYQDRPTGSCPVLREWLNAAAERAAATLCDELWDSEDGIEYVLRGPTTRRVPNGETRLQQDQIDSVITTARWVYESGPEAEVRHALVTSELCRSWPTNADWITGITAKASDALESARIAYRLHLSETSSESVRLLTELRRTLAEETTKITKYSRELITSLWRSFVLAAGVILTNLLTVQKDGAYAYISWIGPATAIVIGTTFLFETTTQRRAIDQMISGVRTWRTRLFGYVQDEDFEALADTPISKANKTYWMIWTLLLLFHVFLVYGLSAAGLGWWLPQFY